MSLTYERKPRTVQRRAARRRSHRASPRVPPRLDRALGNHRTAQLAANPPGGLFRDLPPLSGDATMQRQEEKDENDGKKAPPAPKPKRDWTRAHKKGPRLLDGRAASYQVFFDHVLPEVPKGVTQMWQVVIVNKQRMDKKCAVNKDTTYVVDIVDIGNRKRITDSWGWIDRSEPPFAVESNTATIGFDDQKSDYTQQTSVNVSKKDGEALLSKMAGPKATYTGTYTFAAKSGECADEVGKQQKSHGAPEGEALQIDGVGKWTS